MWKKYSFRSYQSRDRDVNWERGLSLATASNDIRSQSPKTNVYV